MRMKLLVIVALCACSKDKDAPKKEEPKAAPADAAKAEPPKATPLPIKAFVEPDTAQLAFKPQNVLGKTPEDVAKELSQYLRKDKTSAAVQAKTEELMKDMTEDMKKMGIDPSKKKTDIEFRLPPTPATKGDSTHVILHTRDDGTIRQYGVWFRCTEAEANEIVKAFDEVWGAHKQIKETLGPRMNWFDPKLGIRASTEVNRDKPDGVDIDYVRYLPLASFFGEPGPVWGFEKKERPLLGATVEELQATYGKEAKIEVSRDPNSSTVTMTLPPTDYEGDSAVTTILMFIEKGKVRQWNTSLPFRDYEPARAEYGAALDAKFGKPKPARREHLIYSKKPTVDVNYSKFTDELDIEVSR